MGEVYRGRDTKLGREVAIKVLPEEFSRDKERLARFEREAKLLASLNHANIATLYGLEEWNGQQFLAMELVEGETLAEMIARGPIAIDDAIPLFIQIAEGLEAAHEKGIVHRDLKPANVKITPEGQIKILDFRLAKAFAVEQDVSAAASQSPTLTKGTALGAIMGTPAYMSPEQARGKPIDRRTDVWAFGCCLYEALSGQKPFEGDNVTDVLAAVVGAPPDWKKLEAKVTADVLAVVGQSLEKERRQRFQHLGDVRIMLERARFQPKTSVGRIAQDRFTAGAVAMVALASAVAGASLLQFLSASSSVPAEVRRASISFPEGQSQRRRLGAPFAISPSGDLLTYAAQDTEGSALFLRSINSFETRRFDGTDEADKPFFSPDGRWVGFFAAGKLKKVSVERGSVQTIANAPFGWGASWGDDGSIIFSPANHSGLLRVSSDGGSLETLTTPGVGDGSYAHVWPQHLHGSGYVLFTTWGGIGDGELENAAVLDIASGEWNTLMEASGAQYVASGHLVFSNPAKGSGLFASTFDPLQPTEAGPAIPVVQDVRFLATESARPYISVSQTGTLVYADRGAGQATLGWMNRDGAIEPFFAQNGSVAHVRASPDGRSVAFHDEQGNIGVLDTTRGSVDFVARSVKRAGARLGMYSYRDPIWSPDGLRITMSSVRGVSWDLYEVELSGRPTPAPLLDRAYAQYASSWSRDGTALAFTEFNPTSGNDILLFRSSEEPIPIVATEFNEAQPVFSPNGRLLAYVSDESGRTEVYVTTYPQGGTYKVSTNGGSEPVWSRDGGELFFRDDEAFLSAYVTVDPELRASAPEVLHTQPFDAGLYAGAAQYDTTPDGEHFLVVTDRSTTKLNVVFNWFQELEQLAPSREN